MYVGNALPTRPGSLPFVLKPKTTPDEGETECRLARVTVTMWGLTGDLPVHAAPTADCSSGWTSHEASWLDTDEGIITAATPDSVDCIDVTALDLLLLHAIPCNTNDNAKDWRQQSRIEIQEGHTSATDDGVKLKRLLSCRALLDRLETQTVRNPNHSDLPALRDAVVAEVDRLLEPVSGHDDIVGFLLLRTAAYRRGTARTKNKRFREMWDKLACAFPRGEVGEHCHLRGSDMLCIAAVPAELCQTHRQEMESEARERPADDDDDDDDEAQLRGDKSGFECFDDAVVSAAFSGETNPRATAHFDEPFRVHCLCMAVRLTGLSASSWEQAVAHLELGRSLQTWQRVTVAGLDYCRQYCAERAIQCTLDALSLSKKDFSTCHLLLCAVALYLTTVGPNPEVAPEHILFNGAPENLRTMTPNLAAQFIMDVLHAKKMDASSCLVSSVWSPAEYVLRGGDDCVVSYLHRGFRRTRFEASVAAATVLGGELLKVQFDEILEPFQRTLDQFDCKLRLQYALVASAFDNAEDDNAEDDNAEDDNAEDEKLLAPLIKSTEGTQGEGPAIAGQAISLFEKARSYMEGELQIDRPAQDATLTAVLNITEGLDTASSVLLQRCLAVAAMSHARAVMQTSMDHRALVARSMVIPDGWSFVERHIQPTGDQWTGGEGTVSRVRIPGWVLGSQTDVDDLVMKCLPHSNVSVALDGTPESDHILPRHIIMPCERKADDNVPMAAVLMPLATPFVSFLHKAADAVRDAHRKSTGTNGLKQYKQMKRGVYAVTMYVFDSAQRGLRHLHERGKSHCDMKPDNIVMKYESTERDLLLKFGTAWDACQNANDLSLRAMANHLRSIDAAPRVSLIDISDNVFTPRYAPAVSMGGAADDDYAWGLSLYEALLQVENICRAPAFALRPLEAVDALRALHLPESQQLAPLFVAEKTSQQLVDNASLLRLRNTTSVQVPHDRFLFDAYESIEFDIMEEKDGECVFRVMEGRHHIALEKAVELLHQDTLTSARIEELDEHQIPWRAAIVVLHHAYKHQVKRMGRKGKQGSGALIKLEELRGKLLNVTRRSSAAQCVPWEAILRWVGAATPALKLTMAHTHRCRDITLPCTAAFESWQIAFATAAARVCARSFGHCGEKESDLRQCFVEKLLFWFMFVYAPATSHNEIVPGVDGFSYFLTSTYEPFYSRQRGSVRRTITIEKLSTKGAVVAAATALDSAAPGRDKKALVFAKRNDGASVGHCVSVISGTKDCYDFFDKDGKRCSALWDDENEKSFEQRSPLAAGYSIAVVEAPTSPTGTPSSPASALRSRLQKLVL